MRTIKYIVIHCTASHQTSTVDDIKREFKEKGWKNPGYHHLIRPDGAIFDLLPIEDIANGVAGYNSNSIHISYIGGIDKNLKAIDNRTDKQKYSILGLIGKYNQMFPNAIVLGHRDFSPDKNHNGIIDPWEYIKQCPCFSVRDWLKEQGLDVQTRPTGIVYKLNFPMIKDDNVLTIQKALKKSGYQIECDSYFGRETNDALIDFQRKNGLYTNGIVDKITCEKLGIKLIFKC